MRVVIRPGRNAYAVKEYDVEDDTLWYIYESLGLPKSPWIREVSATTRDGRPFYVVVFYAQR